MPVAMTEGGSIYYLAYDQVGSLRLIADSGGNIVKQIDYDTFGNIIDDSNPEFTILFGFAGGLHDRDPALVRFGYRDYLPELGKRTAKDPVDFAAGDSNLYGYVQNDPVNWIDPEGLYAESYIDLGSLSVGYSSYLNNVSNEDYGAAAIDTLGIVADAVMFALPGATVGAGYWIKGLRDASKRALWQINRYDKVVDAGKFGKVYRDPSTGLWWSKDTTQHGGSAWKVFKEEKKGLRWYKDADQYGTFLSGKHKGSVGVFIPWKNTGGK